MVYVKPPYVDWPGDLFVVAAWTAAWGLAHALLDRGFLVPLANSLFKAKTDADISLPPAGTRKKMKSAVTASPSDNQKAAKPSDDAKAVMRIRQKFIYSGWKCFAYSLSTAVGVVVLSEDSWWTSPKEWLLDYPDPTSWLMKTYYYIGFGSYVYQTLTVMSASKQSDFWGVVVHHIATLSVMAASYAFGFTRIGVIILLLHDCSDPFMEFAKCNLYMGKQKVG
ncbi:Ceramide synthase 3 [Entophlyctis luteolus]|nr:Ceramide synthase 3 [Entophlyctis luteolus]